MPMVAQIPRATTVYTATITAALETAFPTEDLVFKNQMADLAAAIAEGISEGHAQLFPDPTYALVQVVPATGTGGII